MGLAFCRCHGPTTRNLIPILICAHHHHHRNHPEHGQAERGASHRRSARVAKVRGEDPHYREQTVHRRAEPREGAPEEAGNAPQTRRFFRFFLFVSR